VGAQVFDLNQIGFGQMNLEYLIQSSSPVKRKQKDEAER
jgi:hypothetical protein